MYRTELICPLCGNIDTIQRATGHKKRNNHIKDLYCFKCKKETKHIELGDKKTYYCSLKNKAKLNEIEKLVLSLLEPSDKEKVR